MTGEAVSSRPVPWTHWLTAARPATLSAAVAPVLVGAAAAGADGHFRPPVFAATLAAALLIQIGTNLANDLFDFERGADTAERLGPPRVAQSGLIPPEQVRLGTYVAFGAAAGLGLYLMFVGGWPIVAIGVLSIAAGVAYTGGPWPLGYHGLGDLLVFVFFGLVALAGTYYLQAEELSVVALVAAVPVGLLVTAILVANNLRDIETDARAGKRTLAVRLGERPTRLQYALLVLGAYACLPALLLVDVGAWAWLPWLTLPLALVLSRTVLLGARGRALNPVLKWTAQLHLAFGSLLALGLLL
ncbi:MAG: 1,4-dihydroxy-2-naphthoate polyprenyltransferase [Chloroflexi bacterium RBG_16_68_14]|nr:MAG: 1,4-dihydroxy-2-naphthoate polyprenyltransferase [Chloroflexi bacterium RBG_16_68_14]